MLTNEGSRHLGGTAGVKKYLDEGAPGLIRVDGNPIGYLTIDPGGKRLGVQLPAEGPLTDCSRYEHVATTRVRRDGRDWYEFGVVGIERIEELYPLLCRVLDRVQLEGQSFNGAVLDVLKLFRSVLSTRAAMTDSDQIGLYGELLVLEHFVSKLGTESAMEHWLGPAREEHDFAFDSFDVEVKTTSGERRQHWISSPTQLTPPTDAKKLFLLSIQITGTSNQGRSLPQMIATIADRIGPYSESFLAELANLGYRQSDADLYPKTWTLRSRPAGFCVDKDFPAIRMGGDLVNSIPEITRIVDFRYLVDLTGGLPQSTPEVLDDLTRPPEESE